MALLFVSRWDSAVSKDLPVSLHNRLGIAMAKRTYSAHRALLKSARWQTLAAAGARPQRLLWASIGTKDLAASDTLYVEALVALDTIKTVPEKPLLALTRHGGIGPGLRDDDDDAGAELAGFRAEGVDDVALAMRLQQEGVASVEASWRAMPARAVAFIGKLVNLS